MKYNQNCFQNSGGDAYLLKTWSELSSLHNIGGVDTWPLKSVAIVFNHIVRFTMSDIKFSVYVRFLKKGFCSDYF